MAAEAVQRAVLTVEAREAAARTPVEVVGVAAAEAAGPRTAVVAAVAQAPAAPALRARPVPGVAITR